MRTFFNVLGLLLIGGGALIFFVRAGLDRSTTDCWAAMGAGLFCIAVGAILERLDDIREAVKKPSSPPALPKS